jgi:ABC-type multidrug transport system ATPase subunit
MGGHNLSASLSDLAPERKEMNTNEGSPLASEIAICFEDVSCRIKHRTILDSVWLSVKQGTITGILGPNGAGKTTLLSLVTELRRPSTGEITVLGKRLPVRGGGLRRRIGVVLQETALYDELTTAENLRFAASLYDIRHPQHRIGEVLDLLGLTGRANDIVGTLSGGLRRRVAVARALLHQPELLIIDEPTLGVDVDARHAIWSHLRLLRSRGTTILAATNYLDEALALCDLTAVLRQGKLLTYEAPQSLVARAGSCLDVECLTSAAEEIVLALAGVECILRIDPTPSGLSIFIRGGNTAPEDILRLILPAASINGFRTRAADLAEVFKALEVAS